MNKKEFILPLYGLSAEVKGIVEHFASVQKCPTNFVATSVLTAIGALAGKRLVVKDGGYSNFGQMYVCLVATPGVGKSPAMDVVMKAIEEIDYHNYIEYKNEVKLWKSTKKEGEAEKPTLRKVVADDVTMEKLMSIINENENGIILHCDELTDLTRNLNRYSNGDNLPKFLKMWSNSSVRVDRKSDEPLMVQRPFLSVLSSTQPVNLEGIFAKHQGTGFFSRWIFCLPNSKPSNRIDPNNIYYDYWAKLVDVIYNIPEMEVTFSEEAIPLLESFDDMRESAAESLGENDPELAEYYMKQKYNIRRLAGIVHLISSESDIIKGIIAPQISKEEFMYAEKLVELYEQCAKETLQMIGSKRVSAMTDKKLLQEFNERFHPTNISELARLIGKSQQYVSKVLLHKDTTQVESEEKRNEKDSQEIRQYIQTNCPRLTSIDGLPTNEDVSGMIETASNTEKAEAILLKMEKYDGIEKARGTIYNIMFSQLIE